MKALIFRETGEPKSVLKLEEISTPPLTHGEALVRVLLSPIKTGSTAHSHDKLGACCAESAAYTGL